MESCSECGAASQRGRDCRDQWNDLLAQEFSDPRAGEVHFLTVACYQLQHPHAFPLNPRGREQLLQALRDVVVDGRPVNEARDALQRLFEGTTRVRADADHDQPAVTWSHTIADVGLPNLDDHAPAITAWATAVCMDLAAIPGQ